MTKADKLWRERNQESLKRSRKRYYAKHKKEIYAKATIWKAANPEKVKASAIKRNRKIRQEMIEAYGSKCACCGETRNEFLTIDHIDGSGAEHRRKVRRVGGVGFYAWLKKAGWPKKNFRLLCMNCNCARGVFGYCPHERETKSDLELQVAEPFNVELYLQGVN